MPLGYKAAKLADLYAIPLYSGLIFFYIIKLLCALIKLNDEYFIRDILETLGLFFGVYIGQKLNLKIKVVVTALLGAMLCSYGITMAFKLQPIHPKDTLTKVLYMLGILVLFILGWQY